jgi:putative transposase
MLSMPRDDLKFFDPRQEIGFSRNRLPHWQQKEGRVYFVTFRLGDALPQSLLQSWTAEREAWLEINPPPWSGVQAHDYDERFTGRIEGWLDAGVGACPLRRPDCASLVAAAMRHFDAERYQLISWVVMPNHVHVIFALRGVHRLERILHSWTLSSARGINALLGQDGHLWQRDYFDRRVRDAAQFARCVRYVRNNPRAANLRENEYLLFESELARQIA